MRRLIIVPALFVVTAVLGQPAARGQSKPDLPTADTVLSQYVEATGGKAAYEKLKNRVSTGTIEIPAANIKGTVKITQAPPNKTAVVTELGPVGVSKRVTDGKNAWEVSSLQGDRELSGEEKETFLRESSFFKEILWKDLYSKVECVGIEDVEGKPAYKVVLTPKSGKPGTEFYDKKTHLLVKQSSTMPSPMGDVEVNTFPSDYKTVDGVLIPFTATTRSIREIVIKTSRSKHKCRPAADTFNRPRLEMNPPRKRRSDGKSSRPPPVAIRRGGLRPPYAIRICCKAHDGHRPDNA